MRKFNFPPVRCRRGFSLVEILVAISILALIGVFLSQMIAATSSSISVSNRAIDAAGQARLALDRISLDIAALVRRSDTDFRGQNSAPASNMLQFLSQIPAAAAAGTDNRRISVIGYRLGAHPDNDNRACLLRGGKSVAWNDKGYLGLRDDGIPVRFGDPEFPAKLLPTATSDFDIVAQGVIRLAVAYQLYPDNLPITLEDGTNFPNSQGQLVYSPPIRLVTPKGGGSAVKIVDLGRVSALVVGVVVLDLQSLRLVDAAQIDQLAGAFPLPGNNILPETAWAPLAEQTAAGSSPVPLPVRQALRVAQRFYPITPFPHAAP